MQKLSSCHVVIAPVRVLAVPYINFVLGVWGKYHCICVIMIDLRCMPDLLWDYPVLCKSYLLSVLLDFTCNFIQSPAIGAQTSS